LVSPENTQKAMAGSYSLVVEARQ